MNDMRTISMLATLACAVAFALPGLGAATAPPPSVAFDWGAEHVKSYEPSLPAMFLRAEEPLEIGAEAIGALGLGLKSFVVIEPVEVPGEMPDCAREIGATFAAKPPGNPVLRPRWRGAWDFAACHLPCSPSGRGDPRAG